MNLDNLSVFSLVQLIWADAVKRSSGHVTTREMAKLTGIANSTWHKLMAGGSKLRPSQRTYMSLSDYLRKLRPPLMTESGFEIPCDWAALQALDEAYRRSGTMTASEAMIELKEIRQREADLIEIIVGIANNQQ